MSSLIFRIFFGKNNKNYYLSQLNCKVTKSFGKNNAPYYFAAKTGLMWFWLAGTKAIKQKVFISGSFNNYRV
jgi:hypothetical protein